MQKLILLILFLFSISILDAQEATVFGRVMDNENGQGLAGINIYCYENNVNVKSDENGNYKIIVPANQPIKLKFSEEGYEALEYNLPPLKEDSKRYLNAYLGFESSISDVTIIGSRIDDGGMVREEVSEFKMLPSSSGNFEAVLPSIALGVNMGTGGELSSQYNVRGGNYDENLIYINDFEVFRPQLIRAGQQEGLSFPNIDLIRDISFSSGGYESVYGNKMASVLDIRYKRPEKLKTSISGSLLGANAHIEGSKRLGPNAYHKFRYLVGARYKTNKYLLGSLDVKGEYIPDFFDFQTYLTYDVTKSIQLAFLGNYNSSIFEFYPLSRATTLGLLTNALRFTTAFQGGERDKFIHGLTGFSINIVPERKSRPYFIKLLGSRYSGSESENYDIIGDYRLSQIESDFNSKNFNKELAVLGTGTQHRYARNFLYNEIINSEIKTGLELSSNNNSHFIESGFKWQREFYDDYLNEWERIDSAGYSLPYTGKEVIISKVLKTDNIIKNQKLDFYLQDKFSIINKNYKIVLNGGLRFSHIQYTNENLISPRISINYAPSSDNAISYKLAYGIYYQTPFYREFRLPDGKINPDLNSQKSTHYVTGIDYDFYWNTVSKKPFRLISELYYKKFDNLISYDVDNVRIAYSGRNDSKGYAAGIDLRINGEFVPDAESWVNFSILRTRESINGVQHKTRKDTSYVNTPDVPRPTDRLFSSNIFFQDYLPMNKKFKANINYSFATGLPFGTKDNNVVLRNIFRYKNYQRLDIGFSYMIWDRKEKNKSLNNPFNFSEKTWLSLEVLNILNISNTASISWVKTITNTQYAINNNLTSRRVNLRFRIDF